MIAEATSTNAIPFEIVGIGTGIQYICKIAYAI